MSLVFNDQDAYKGLVQEYEREIGVDYGDVSGSVRRLKAFTVSVNLTFDRYWRRAFKADGTWKLDDSNHTDSPEVKTNLVSGQRKYSFLNDEEGNLILEFDRVWIMDQNGVYRLAEPVDADSEDGLSTFFDGQNLTGTPSKYDKSGNEFILDLVPSYNATLGLKASIKREASYFVYTDTSKKPGVPGHHHAYFFLVPAEDYARRQGLKSLPDIQRAIKALEDDIDSHFSRRTVKDEKPRISIKQQNNK